MHLAETKAFMLTGGTDMRLRYWDLKNPTESKIVTQAALDQNTSPTQYRSVSHLSYTI